MAKRVLVSRRAPAAFAGREFQSLRSFLAELQGAADSGLVAAGAAFSVTVTEGAAEVEFRFACVGENGAAYVTGPGGRREGTVWASQVLRRGAHERA